MPGGPEPGEFKPNLKSRNQKNLGLISQGIIGTIGIRELKLRIIISKAWVYFLINKVKFIRIGSKAKKLAPEIKDLRANPGSIFLKS